LKHFEPLATRNDFDPYFELSSIEVGDLDGFWFGFEFGRGIVVMTVVGFELREVIGERWFDGMKFRFEKSWIGSHCGLN
jgi:hypothetical protein